MKLSQVTQLLNQFSMEKTEHSVHLFHNILLNISAYVYFIKYFVAADLLTYVTRCFVFTVYSVT